MTNKKCKTIEVCIAEGKFAGIFGWSLTHTPIGGFLGLPGIFLLKFYDSLIFQGGQVNCMMPSMDVYSRDGDKLSENWIILDLVYWLKDQGLDVFKRTNEILNPDWI